MANLQIDTEIDPRYRVFQSLFYVDAKAGAEKELRKQLQKWLEESGREFKDISLEKSGFYPSPRSGVDLRLVHSESSEGIAYQAKITESKEDGTWRSTFTFSLPKSKSEAGWILIRIDNDAGHAAKPPRLLRYLVEAELVVDGGLPMPLEAQVYRPTMLADLWEEIASQDRRTPIFVAATDLSKDFDKFVADAKKWAQKLPGLAKFVVLDPPASKNFRDGLGEEFAVPSWTVRSYLPGVSKEQTFDSRRHKILGTKRLQEPTRKIQGTLETIARGHAYQEVFPDYVNGTLRRLQRLEDKAMIAAIVSEPDAVVPTKQEARVQDPPEVSTSIADEAEDYLAKLSLVESVLGIDEITRESLEQLARVANTGYVAQAALDSLKKEFNQRQNQVESLETYTGELVISINEMESELGMLEEERRRLADRSHRLERENQWLLRQIDESARYQSEYLALSNPTEIEPPRSWEDFITKVSALTENGIIFTGDVRKTQELEANDDIGNFVRNAWDCVIVLKDYIDSRRTGSWDKGMHDFIENEGTFSPRRHAQNESGVTRANNKKNNERDFPVPNSVSSNGFATMYAHFKLGKKGRIDPRMYYLDNFTQDGFVYIGYVGEHLKNTLT
jgi:hypothetical protein